MQQIIQTYTIFKERVILRFIKLFFHNSLTESYIIIIKISLYMLKNRLCYFFKKSKIAQPITYAKCTGTALPICVYLSPILPDTL